MIKSQNDQIFNIKCSEKVFFFDIQNGYCKKAIWQTKNY